MVIELSIIHTIDVRYTSHPVLVSLDSRKPFSVQCYSSAGSNWITYDVAGDFFAISMINQQTGYISGQNSKVLKTTNGGQSWTSMTNASGSNYSLYAMEFVNESTGWAFVNYSSVAGGNVFKTTNGGLNWSQYMLAQLIQEG
jgi:photosystem II stability/assembly factor-like uncharacterized protein